MKAIKYSAAAIVLTGIVALASLSISDAYAQTEGKATTSKKCSKKCKKNGSCNAEKCTPDCCAKK